MELVVIAAMALLTAELVVRLTQLQEDFVSEGDYPVN